MTDIIITNEQTTITLTRDCNALELTNGGNTAVVSRQGSPGPQGPAGEDGLGVPAGGEARQGLRKIDATDNNTEWAHTWQDFATNVEYTGVEAIIASGTAYTATIGGSTVYRFVNSTNNANGYPLEDSFYSDFDGTNLTGLIVSRG